MPLDGKNSIYIHVCTDGSRSLVSMAFESKSICTKFQLNLFAAQCLIRLCIALSSIYLLNIIICTILIKLKHQRIAKFSFK